MSDYPADPDNRPDPHYTDFDDEGRDQADPYIDPYPIPDDTPAPDDTNPLRAARRDVPTPPPTPPRGIRRTAPPPEVYPDIDEPTPPPRRAAPSNTRGQARPQATPDRSAPRDSRPDPRAERGKNPRTNYTSYLPPDPNIAQYPPDPRAKRRKPPSRSGMYLPWWSLVVMLVAVGGLAFGSLLVVNSLGGQAAPGGSTPIIVVITATYTVGPPASQTGIPQKATLTPTRPLPTIASTATLPAGNIAIGTQIQIVGVGGSGLNVRSGPGKQFTAKFLAQDGQVFTVKDGPQTASDEEWWYIEDPTNPNIGGWASRRFLQGK